jgi:hypothetical protein
VVRKFETTSLRSETKLGWSHLKELARIGDDKRREQLLEKVSDGFRYSVREIRQKVDTELRRRTETEPGHPGRQRDLVYVSVPLRQAHRKLVKAFARAEEKRPDEVLRRIIEDHLIEKKEEIEDKIQRARLRSKGRRP